MGMTIDSHSHWGVVCSFSGSFIDIGEIAQAGDGVSIRMSPIPYYNISAFFVLDVVEFGVWTFGRFGRLHQTPDSRLDLSVDWPVCIVTEALTCRVRCYLLRADEVNTLHVLHRQRSTLEHGEKLQAISVVGECLHLCFSSLAGCCQTSAGWYCCQCVGCNVCAISTSKQ